MSTLDDSFATLWRTIERANATPALDCAETYQLRMGHRIEAGRMYARRRRAEKPSRRPFPERDAEIWHRHFVRGESFRAIGDVHSLTRSRMAQIAQRLEDERVHNARAWLTAADDFLYPESL